MSSCGPSGVVMMLFCHACKSCHSLPATLSGISCGSRQLCIKAFSEPESRFRGS
ncbi:uncharacterized protein LY79DRAFT_198080 [Colletotrichum navitas]|uniref:Uncharacterized protein n=1 Tax=Colletotrichum navitas TaxID=681940 RepID=A0AAD8PZ07_9PEZI|nr:uncharacterized protein LY79DRAFT_198080 [Colletotrichum navitas]KAK1590729.1 hypothetical protein LY79DRAFT_198080 [Colletotrichum navitas]